MTETVAAFERHLLDNLDDVAAWSAYADYLTEQGEPRGDFMRVQLALEDETLPKAERRALHEEEEALRVKHLDEWVGESFAAENFDAKGVSKHQYPRFVYRRGWLWESDGVSWDEQNVAGDLSAWRWMHTLKVSFGEVSLTDTPLPRNLRSLQIGDDETRSDGYFEDLDAFIAAASRMERLYLACGDANTAALFGLPLAHLRELHVHCGTLYATDTLAENRAFAGLRTLAFHPHGYYGAEPRSFSGGYLNATDVRTICHAQHLKRLEHLQLNCLSAGDAGIDLLVTSGLIHRLKSLDLRHGCVSDEGAFTLFKALDGKPHALQVLKLGDNALTGDGVAALRRLKLSFDAPDQHRPGDDHYLTQGDFECSRRAAVRPPAGIRRRVTSCPGVRRRGRSPRTPCAGLR